MGGVEADRSQLQRFLHGSMQVIHAKGLKQAEHLHILAAPHLEHARLHQAAQGMELFGQVPFRQGRGLVQRIDLALDQREVVERVKDHVLAIVTTRVSGDHLPATTDHDLIDIAADPDILVAIGDRDRVIVGVIAHERLGADPSTRLVASIERGGRQGRIAARSRCSLSPIVFL